jgi:hypothetical protein
MNNYNSINNNRVRDFKRNINTLWYSYRIFFQLRIKTNNYNCIPCTFFLQQLNWSANYTAVFCWLNYFN